MMRSATGEAADFQAMGVAVNGNTLDLTAAIDREELSDLARALEQLGLVLRLTPALIELQEAVRLSRDPRS